DVFAGYVNRGALWVRICRVCEPRYFVDVFAGYVNRGALWMCLQGM
ncbi:hypothetical protein HNQ69_001658, partial [Bartonella callosciuri]|nr:hypothetical protein [Bartonella callosciuri]